MTLNSVTTGTHTLKITGDEAWQETVNVTENITSQTTAKITRLEVKNFDWETEMIFVKGGSFTMGCTPEQGSNCFSDEKPSHQVILNDYYIGKYEVTRNQWSEVMGSIPIRFFGCIDCPINGADWSEIQEFIKRLNQKTGKNYRLPTEAEWEYAARGGNRSSGFIYSGSNVIDEVAWYGGNSEKKTHPVGQKKPNNLGLYDMSGNVNELCVDWYVEYDDISQFNPRGPEKGDHHVHRGGAWDEGMWYRSSSGYCRVSNRETSLSDRGEGYCHIGFRLCRSAE
nr:formylglycine-generating enzyme family protein [Bacteroidota bacterium]